MQRPIVLSGAVASGLCGGCLPVDLELMDVQAVDLKLLDLEVSDHRSPDRKPANGQGADGTGANCRCADGTGANCRCADRGRAKASRSKLHRGTLLPAGTESGKGPREGPAVVHECSSSARHEPRRQVGCRSSLLHYHLPPLAKPGRDWTDSCGQRVDNKRGQGLLPQADLAVDELVGRRVAVAFDELAVAI
jgi:hypothetical protein